MRKDCELCGECATLLCPADNAHVCWSCDAKVHTANFLVARHTRSVLCDRCCRPTDCRISGPHPSPLFRLCDLCDASAAKELLSEDCNGDSESLSLRSAATGAEDSESACESQESHIGAHVVLAHIGKASTRAFLELASAGKRYRARCVEAGQSKLSLALERGKKNSLRRRKKRSSSPASVIQMARTSVRSFNRISRGDGVKQIELQSRI